MEDVASIGAKCSTVAECGFHLLRIKYDVRILEVASWCTVWCRLAFVFVDNAVVAFFLYEFSDLIFSQEPLEFIRIFWKLSSKGKFHIPCVPLAEIIHP